MYQNATGVPNVTTLTNLSKMTKNDPSVRVYYSVLCISTWAFERTHHLSPKIQDDERPPYLKSFLAVFFVFLLHSYCISGFDERRLSYRLRYTCCNFRYIAVEYCRVINFFVQCIDKADSLQVSD